MKKYTLPFHCFEDFNNKRQCPSLSDIHRKVFVSALYEVQGKYVAIFHFINFRLELTRSWWRTKVLLLSFWAPMQQSNKQSWNAVSFISFLFLFSSVVTDTQLTNHPYWFIAVLSHFWDPPQPTPPLTQHLFAYYHSEDLEHNVALGEG